MKHEIKGIKDIHKLLVNERKLGGVIETGFIRLKTEEIFHNAVITNIDLLGSSIYSVGIFTEEGEHLIVNISEIGLINKAEFKKVCELNNQAYKVLKTNEKIKYLKRLFEVNKESHNPIFLHEAKMIIEDVGLHAAKKVVDTNQLYKNSENIYSIA